MAANVKNLKSEIRKNSQHEISFALFVFNSHFPTDWEMFMNRNICGNLTNQYTVMSLANGFYSLFVERNVQNLIRDRCFFVAADKFTSTFWLRLNKNCVHWPQAERLSDRPTAIAIIIIIAIKWKKKCQQQRSENRLFSFANAPWFPHSIESEFAN